MRAVAVGTMILLALACASQGPHRREPASEHVRLSELPAHDLANCMMFDLVDIGAVDVAIAIDASRSTVDPTGTDINENGVIGKQVFNRRKVGFVSIETSDPGDSFLSAQVSGVLSLIRGLGSGDARFAVIAFSGASDQEISRSGTLGRAFDAVTESELTNQVEALEAALERVLEAGSVGTTDFTAGMRLAQHALESARAARPASRRLVLFMSDSPTPVLSHDGKQRHDPAMKDAALEAVHAGTVFHTFGLSAETAEQPGFLVDIARDTGGRFFGVPDLAELHCKLAESLVP